MAKPSSELTLEERNTLRNALRNKYNIRDKEEVENLLVVSHECYSNVKESKLELQIGEANLRRREGRA